MKLLLAIAVVAFACGGKSALKQTTPDPVPESKTLADKIVALLPPNAQIIVELDLARLRANPVVGETFTKVTAAPIDLPADLPKPPLAIADVIVFAAYGVGTSSAATIVVIGSTQEIADATRIRDGLWAMGPGEWIRQLEARAALDVPVVASRELLELRERSMPK